MWRGIPDAMARFDADAEVRCIAFRGAGTEAFAADADIEPYVDDVINTLCENAPLSIANTKTVLEEFVKSSGSADPARMRAAIERCAKSADYIEGRRAFMEKRKPRFTGK